MSWLSVFNHDTVTPVTVLVNCQHSQWLVIAHWLVKAQWLPSWFSDFCHGSVTTGATHLELSLGDKIANPSDHSDGCPMGICQPGNRHSQLRSTPPNITACQTTWQWHVMTTVTSAIWY